MTLYINASEISALTGRNRFKCADESFVELLARRHSELYDIIIQAIVEDDYIYLPYLISKGITIQDNERAKECYEKKIRQGLLEPLTEQGNNVELPLLLTKQQRFQQDYIHFKYDNNELINSLTEAKEIIPDLIKQIPPEIKQELVKERGIKLEIPIAQLLETFFIPAKIEYSGKLVTRLVNKNIKVGGKVDCYIIREGIRTGIIEIKTRTNSFFTEEKLLYYGYDLDQLAVYSFLHPELKEFYLCQYYNGEIKLNKYEQEALQKRWDEIKEKLLLVKQYFEYVKNNPTHVTILKIFRRYVTK